MAAPQDLILDAWSPLSHKSPVGDGTRWAGQAIDLAPTWVPEDQRRRLNAYKILHAYRANVARVFLLHKSDREKASHREYGDPALIIDRVAAGVLGDDPQIVIDGADRDLPDAPELPPEPGDPGPDGSSIDRRIYTARHDRWAALVDQALTDWEHDWDARPGLLARQAQLRSWADTEQLLAKLVEGEGDIVGLGDGVYVLSLSTVKGRPLLDVYDPGFYFPVLDDTTRDFPDKVHVAWQYETTDVDGRTRQFVRRLTWELVDVRTTPSEPDALLDATARRYPWAPDTDSWITCLHSDGTWRLEDINGRYYTDLDETTATWASNEDGYEVRRLDLRQDWIPVLHVANTPASKDTWGQSILAVVAQVLDDLAGADTDTRAAARLAAVPAIALSGASGTELQVRPGAVFNTGPDGHMDVLDLSQGLTQLREIVSDLIDRFLVNARVPKEVVGWADTAQAASGILVQLAFGPFTQLISQLRLSRDPKYALLLKMVQRMFQMLEVFDRGTNPTARLAFGPYLPSDLSALIQQVTDLLTAKAISRQTGIQILVAGGLTISDAHHELERIRSDDTLGAKDVADATGSEKLAAERLGLDLPAPAAVSAPTINLPPPPGVL